MTTDDSMHRLQAFVSRYELNKRWLVFYASTLAAAYLYLRPFIRRKLGSAQRSVGPAPASRSASRHQQRPDSALARGCLQHTCC